METPLTYLTILETTDTSLVWKKVKILPNDTRTILVSFVAWQLENLVNPDITVTKKPKNFLINIANIRVNPQDFKGVELTDFPQIETFYETQPFAMLLKEDGSAKTLYLSQA